MPQLSPSFWMLLILLMFWGLFCFFCSMLKSKPMQISSGKLVKNSKKSTLYY